MQDVHELMNNILNEYQRNPEAALALCEQLKTAANEQNDSYGVAFATFYTGAAFYMLGRFDDVIEILSSSIAELGKDEFFLLQVKAYNMLGLIFLSRAQIFTALDYFMTGISVARDKDLFELCASLYSNMSIIFSRALDYETACRHLEKALEYAGEVSSPGYEILKATYTLNLAYNYICIRNFDEAGKLIKRELLKKYINDNYLPFCFFYDYIYALLAYHNGQKELSGEYIDKVLAMTVKHNVQLGHGSIYISICKFLLDTEDFVKLKALISLLSENKELLTLDACLLDLIDIEIRFGQINGMPQDELRALYREYFDAAAKIKKHGEKMCAAAVTMRVDLRKYEQQRHELEDRKERLINRSEYDALTRLPNRGRLEKVMRQQFETASTEKTHLGILLLDVDCFKQYNDTYGHSRGDRALRSVADVLRHLCSDGIEFFRYGGDEFVGIVREKTDGEIMQLINDIDKSLDTLLIENRMSQRKPYLTVTTGFFNGIPANAECGAEFVNAADMDLYSKKADWKLS